MENNKRTIDTEQYIIAEYDCLDQVLDKQWRTPRKVNYINSASDLQFIHLPNKKVYKLLNDEEVKALYTLTLKEDKEILEAKEKQLLKELKAKYE